MWPACAPSWAHHEHSDGEHIRGQKHAADRQQRDEGAGSHFGDALLGDVEGVKARVSVAAMG